MKDPQQALEAARQAVADDPDQAVAGDPDAGGAPWELEDPTTASKRLVEWAIIDPDQARVYSTRPYGRPLTALKRLLVRFLAQYLNEVSAQQSRFNAAVAAHVMRLEERVAELERDRPPTPPPE